MPVMVGHTRDEVRLMGAIYENDAGGKMTMAQAQQVCKNFFGPGADKVMQEYALNTAPEPNGVCAKVLTDVLFATGEENDRDALGQFVRVFAYRSCDPDAPESTCMRFIQKSEQATTLICPTCSSGRLLRTEA